MSINRITLHQEYINRILEFDVETAQQNEDEIEKEDILLKECKKNFNMTILNNRANIFKKNLETFKLDEIDKNIIIDYTNYIIKNEKIEEKILVDNYDDLRIFIRNNSKNYSIKTLEQLSEKTQVIWSKIVEIDHFVKDEYQNKKFLELLNNIQTNIQKRIEKRKIYDENILQVFIAENISSIDELNMLCNRTSIKGTELIIIEGSEDEMNGDIASVIKMRAKKCCEKGNDVVVLLFGIFEQIIETGQSIHGIQKLSFLHHGKNDFGYVENIRRYIDNLPDLKEIVLRGCGTAENPPNQSILYEVKKMDGSYDKDPSIQGSNQLIIQQKKDIDGGILTKVSWMSNHPDPENKSLIHNQVIDTNVPEITKGKLTTEQIKILEKIHGMPLLKYENSYINKLKEAFFNKDKIFMPNELAHIKKVVRRARTEVALSSKNDLLSDVLKNMTPEQRKKISVKAYVKGYTVHYDHVVPSKKHGQENMSKAVRIGSKK